MPSDRSVWQQPQWRLLAAVATAVLTSLAVVVTLLLISDPLRPAARGDGDWPPAPARHTPELPARTELVKARDFPPAAPASLEVGAIGLRTDELATLDGPPEHRTGCPDVANTAGWHRNSASPGEDGPAVISGHVDYDHVPGVFYRLHGLAAGDQATVHRADRISLLFNVYRVEHYPRSGPPDELLYGDTAEPELRLITCDRQSGKDSKRVVVFGELAYAFRR